MLRKIAKLIAALLLLNGIMACGMGSSYLQHRSEGFRHFDAGVATLPRDPKQYRVIRLPEIRIIIAGDRSYFIWDRARSDEKIKGFANRETISILGYSVGGKIVLNEAVLGHELMHVINWADPAIADPDRLEELFYDRK